MTVGAFIEVIEPTTATQVEVLDEAGVIVEIVDTEPEVTVVEVEEEDVLVIEVETAGPQGPPGPAAEGGDTLVIQPTDPGTDGTTPKAWLQTGLGPSGHGATLWYEDGL